MGLADLTRDAVLAAIAEHDRLGREPFLNHYGFGPARLYDLVHEGRRYDSKAIAGVAHRYATGTVLKPFSGGEQTVVPRLEGLGFTVERRGEVPSPRQPQEIAGLQHACQAILDLAAHYSKDSTPEMADRDARSKELAGVFKTLVGPLSEELGLGDLDVRVQTGGRQANYSPVPWVRLYSKQHSPTAMEGFYLVYLFAADGSRFYLSLNQGTSEYRSGAMRPVNDRSVLLSRAAEARRRLEDFGEALPDATSRLTLDLAWSSLTSVGRESKVRIRNYEDGNIAARLYESGQVPTDRQLLGDIATMLPLLACLYGSVARPEIAAGIPEEQGDAGDDIVKIAKRARGRAQGRQLDPVARKAIEVHAEDIAESYLQERDWSVKRVGPLNRGYDLECWHPDGRRLHVEVKGTQSLGEEIVLTPNEVRHNQLAEGCEAEHALYVVSNIQLRRTPAVQAFGGEGRCIWPWVIDTEALTPTKYAYRPPSQEKPE
ncbi:MrcB family domain-containing protein [Micromonospora sp. URMC 106]|uniref:MrcB family domain-containing protein n=1 Tax=Micromonospora sp. URMC 106 TaxID=3423408 RepID=UPI003F1C0ED6